MKKVIIEQPAKTYKTDIKAGVKCPNRLCEAVLEDMKILNSFAPAVEFSIEEWETELQKSIVENHRIFERCYAPHYEKWRAGNTGEWYITVYASYTAFLTAKGAFMTMKVGT
jgi:hypothetical protein